MVRGGNAENYLYGLVYSAHVMWNSAQTDIADFNRRFAYTWFGVTKEEAADHVDRLFWFPWRISGSAAWNHRDIDGYWQNMQKPQTIFFLPFDALFDLLREEVPWELTQAKKEVTPENMLVGIGENLRTHIEQSEKLLRHIIAARASLQWLRHESTRNFETLESMELVLRVYEHIARKTIVLCDTALVYRNAYAAHDTDALIRILGESTERIHALKGEFGELKAGYVRSVETRGGDPNDILNLIETENSVERMSAKLQNALADIKNGHEVAPSVLGFD